MQEENWKEQYREWKKLKPFEKKLLDEGAKSLSQTWLVNSMWCEWKAIRKSKETEPQEHQTLMTKDPWEE